MRPQGHPVSQDSAASGLLKVGTAGTWLQEAPGAAQAGLQARQGVCLRLSTQLLACSLVLSCPPAHLCRWTSHSPHPSCPLRAPV